MKVLLSAAVLLSVICFCHTAEKLKVTVYYETLSRDCVSFFRTQLIPTYDLLEEYLEIDLVPFGKGTAKKHEDKWEFECQHGPEECEGNAYDACAIDIAPMPKALAFAKCTLVQVDTASSASLKLCAEESGISYKSLEACRQERGDELLAKNAERSKQANYVTVPAVAFNGTYDGMDSGLAVKDLKLIVCALLNDPVPQCKDQLYGF